jgi:transposase
MEGLNMSRQFTKEFKEDAVRYYLEHKDLGITVCAKNLGTSRTALFTWIKNAEANNGEVSTRGSGNYQSDDAKENARLRKELRDTQDALEILKKAISILGK